MGSKARTIARRAGFIGLGALAAWVVIWPDVFQGVRDYPARYLQAATDEVPVGWDAYFRKYELDADKNAVLPLLSGTGEPLVPRLAHADTQIGPFAEGKTVDFREAVLHMGPIFEVLPPPKSLNRLGSGWAPELTGLECHHLANAPAAYLAKGLAEYQAHRIESALEWIDASMACTTILESTALVYHDPIFATEATILKALARIVVKEPRDSKMGSELRRMISNLRYLSQCPRSIYDAAVAAKIEGYPSWGVGSRGSRGWIPGAALAQRSRLLGEANAGYRYFGSMSGSYNSWASMLSQKLWREPFWSVAKAMSHRKMLQQIVQVVDEDFASKLPGDFDNLGYGLTPETEISVVNNQIIASYMGEDGKLKPMFDAPLKLRTKEANQ